MKDFKEYHLGFEAKIVSPEVPGEKSRALLSLQEEVESSVISYPKSMPMAIKRAKGAIVEDVDGNRYIDFFAGCGVLNVGHCNQDVLSSVFKQQKDLIHALDFPTENKMRLINNILSELPAEYRNDYKVGFTSPSGSDAVEAAIKLAKHYTGRSGVLAFQGSYHGMGSGSLAVTSDLSHKSGISSLMPEVNFVPYSYCYRCSFGKNGENCQFECVNYLENLLENPHSGLPKPAAILLEPVQCEGGNIVPKKGYLKRIIELAKKHAVVT
ncbi:MAG: aminotransferase class III-fold pyridoxal phosphate-dependent enzyme, partial [Bacteroidota bacterium]